MHIIGYLEKIIYDAWGRRACQKSMCGLYKTCMIRVECKLVVIKCSVVEGGSDGINIGISRLDLK